MKYFNTKDLIARNRKDFIFFRQKKSILIQNPNVSNNTI